MLSSAREGGFIPHKFRMGMDVVNDNGRGPILTLCPYNQAPPPPNPSGLLCLVWAGRQGGKRAGGRSSRERERSPGTRHRPVPFPFPLFKFKNPWAPCKCMGCSSKAPPGLPPRHQHHSIINLPFGVSHNKRKIVQSGLTRVLAFMYLYSLF